MRMNDLDEENDNTAITFGGITLENEELEYLGGIITYDSKCENKIITRITISKQSISKLTIIWKDIDISLKSKVKFYKPS